MKEHLLFNLPGPNPGTKDKFMQLNRFGKNVKHVLALSSKLRLMMQLTAILVFAACLQVSAAAFGQQVTIVGKDIPLKQVFRDIRKQTGYNFIYTNKVIKEASPVTMNARNMDMREVLDKAMAGQPLTYAIEDKIIIISPKPETVSGSESSLPQKEITGTVKDSATGRPLAGVTVKVKGKNIGTVTDGQGSFSLRVPDNAVLEISYLGYTSKSISVNGNTSFSISLSPAATALNQLVVVGYGTQRRINMTSAVTTVSAKELGRQLSPNVDDALQGLAAGVQVLQNGGIAGSRASIVIRGTASFGSTEPLFIIDGAFSNLGLSSLNPNDIQSIEILKDAAAAAIYGSRAANGVIIITTKKGKKGPPKITLNTIYSIQSPDKYLNYMNTSQYLQFYREVAQNSGITYTPPADTSINTDWQRAWLKPAPMYKVDIGISGGGENNTYYLSLGYLNQDGIVAFSGFKRYDFRIDNSVEKGRLTINENLGISRQSLKPTASIVIGPPTAPIFDKNGSYVSLTDITNFDKKIFSNPLAPLYYSTDKSMHTLINGTLDIGYKIFQGLEYKITGGSSYEVLNTFSHDPVYYTAYDQAGNGLSSYGNSVNFISESRGDVFNYNIDNTVTYKNSFGKNFFDFLIGTSWLDEFSRTDAISSINDLGGTNIIGTGGTVPGNINASSGEDVLLSFFSRLNYNYDEKYLLSASIRNDKSSKFAKNYRSGWFPSISAGWNIQNEKWFSSDIFSELKIRASYGELGANFIDPYQFNNTLLPVPSPFGMTLTNFNTAYAVQLYPANLHWETAISKDIGVDLGAFQSRFTLTIDYYNRINKDLLALVAAPPSSGQGLTQPTGNSARLVPVNSASVRNDGIEFTLGYKKSTGDFNYNINGNLSFIRNKVLSLGQNVPPILGPIMSSTIGDNITITEPGHPIGSFYGFQVVGLTSNGEFEIKGYDSSGKSIDKPISEATPADKKIIGNPFPNFTYSINGHASYKDFDLTLFIQGVQGGDIFNQLRLYSYFGYGQDMTTDLVANVLNSWTSTNTKANIPLASTSLSGENGRPSSFYIENASYLRLKNIQVGYTINFKESTSEVIRDIRFFVGVQNLFTVTKYSGYGPEVSSNTTFARNIDFQDYPNARIFTTGLSASF